MELKRGPEASVELGEKAQSVHSCCVHLSEIVKSSVAHGALKRSVKSPFSQTLFSTEAFFCWGCLDQCTFSYC